MLVIEAAEGDLALHLIVLDDSFLGACRVDVIDDGRAVGEESIGIARLGEPQAGGDPAVGLGAVLALLARGGLGVDVAAQGGDAVAAVLQDRLLQGIAL